MKGAIGNAFIMNMVITFILIFYVLLIGSMAYSKAYKTNNYLLEYVVNADNDVDKNPEKYNSSYSLKTDIKLKQAYYIDSDFDYLHETLQKFGYFLTTNPSCPTEKGIYELIYSPSAGYSHFDYCIYLHYEEPDSDIIYARYNYMVMSYMKFDFPIIGQFIKIPITGETKTFTVFK